MKEHPILFTAPMVNAVLSGRKTVTRRLAKIPAEGRNNGALYDVVPSLLGHGADLFDAQYRMDSPRVVRCPLGAPGHRIWVRETWYDHRPGKKDPSAIDFRATHWCSDWKARCPCADGENKGRWRPSIHMPRWASRISLEVVSVRAERLHAIDDADVEREGIRGWSKDRALWKYAPADDEGDGPCWPWTDCPLTAREAFKKLWTELYGEASWAENPWVWRVEFRTNSARQSGRTGRSRLPKRSEKSQESEVTCG